jgi:hypothetical protein
MDLQTLEAEIESYMHRSDTAFTDRIEGFIEKGLERVRKDLRSVVAETSVTWNQSAPTLPADYGQMRYVTQAGAGGNTVELKPMSMLEAQKWTHSSGSQSIGYVITGDQMAVYPASERDVTLVYWRRPAALVSSSDTNYVTTDYPILALYGALIEAATWVRDDELYQKFTFEFAAALDAANREAERQRWGNAPVASSHYATGGALPRGM